MDILSVEEEEEEEEEEVEILSDDEEEEEGRQEESRRKRKRLDPQLENAKDPILLLNEQFEEQFGSSQFTYF